MKSVVFVVLLGSSILIAPEQSVDGEAVAIPGHHEIDGPVRVLWEARFDVRHDEAVSIDVSPDASKVFVSGTSVVSWGPDAFGYDYSTVSYDARTGEQIWSSLFDGGGGDGTNDDEAASLAVSADGSLVYVTGESEDRWTAQDYATVAYLAETGQEIWRTRYTGPPYSGEQDTAVAVVADPEGSKVYVAGDSDPIGVGLNMVALAYDDSSGWEIWESRLSGPSYGTQSLGISPDGSTLFATGTSWGSDSGREFRTVAYDTDTGEINWVASFDGPESDRDEVRAMVVSPDGSMVFVTGRAWAGPRHYDYAVAAYDAASGEQRWSAFFDGPGPFVAYDAPAAIGVSPDGSTVFVVGTSVGSDSGEDYLTVAYRADTGQEIWTARYDGPASLADLALDVAILPDGSAVIVTGSSQGVETQSDYATAAYDTTTGERIWSARYDGGLSSLDGAVGLDVTPDGATVFVTGSSVGGDRNRDFLTLAYALAVSVEIDIRPHTINPGRPGVLPVVVFGSETFDVTRIDLETLRFGPDGATTWHDLSDPFVLVEHLEDVDRDGFMDLMVHFPVDDAGILWDAPFALLAGSTVEGNAFQGADSIDTTTRCASSRPIRETPGREPESTPRIRLHVEPAAAPGIVDPVARGRH